MRYYKCKCGKCEAWGEIQPCWGCSECNTNFYGEQLKPHDYVTRYNENTGKPYLICKVCMHRDTESYQLSKVKGSNG